MVNEIWIKERILVIIQELRKKYKNVTIVEKAGNYGYVISREETKTCINESGKKEDKTFNVFNILELSGRFACEDWFYTYNLSKNGECIIGYPKKIDDVLKKETLYNYGAINERGCLIVQPCYDYIKFNTDSTLIVGTNGYEGYIDSGTGIKLSPDAVLETPDFRNNLEKIKKLLLNDKDIQDIVL